MFRRSTCLMRKHVDNWKAITQQNNTPVVRNTRQILIQMNRKTGGNLNTQMNIGNQCYNSFRNKLDKKGFITYHNYLLEAKDKKR